MSTGPARVSLDGLSMTLGGRRIVEDVSVVVEPGRIAGLIGPNGAGKSTLLRSIYRHLRPDEGAVVVGADDIWAMRRTAAARRVSAVPQERPTEFDLAVREIVAMGRAPHRGGLLDGSRLADRRAIDDALARVGLVDLGPRPWSSLSGGERQRVLIARALAQEAPVLVLDEPTNHLDIRHQLEVIGLLRELGCTTVMAVHDINLAARCCDTLHLMVSGRVVASGTPTEVLTPDNVREAFGVRSEVVGSGETFQIRFWLDDL